MGYQYSADARFESSEGHFADYMIAENLPGQYAVWAASDEAKFLHGRFTWAAWDVEEISSGKIRERIDGDPNYLKVGVTGL
jgi:hypothetical protein